MQMNWRLITLINAGIALITVVAVIFDVTHKPGRQSHNQRPQNKAQSKSGDSLVDDQAARSRIESLTDLSNARVDDLGAVPAAELTQLMSHATPEQLAAMAYKFNEAPTDARTLGGMAVFFQAWSELDPKAALIGAFGLNDIAFRKLAVGTVVNSVSPSAAPELIAHLTQHPDKDLLDECKNRFLNPLIANWSTLDPEAAAQFMDELGDAKSDLNYTARNSIAYNWGSLDPNAALEWVEKQKDKDFFNRTSVYDEIIRGWCLKDIASASAYVREHLDDPAAETAASSVAEYLFDRNAEDATGWIGRLPDGKARNDAKSTIATMWAEKDPAAAAKWVGTLSDSDKENVVGIIARSWVEKNWPEASRWIDSLNGAARDDALVAAVNRDGATEIESLSLALSIKNPERQSNNIENVIRNWSYNDPEAAKTWVKNSPLSSEAREELMMLISVAQKNAEEATAERVITN